MNLDNLTPCQINHLKWDYFLNNEHEYESYTEVTLEDLKTT